MMDVISGVREEACILTQRLLFMGQLCDLGLWPLLTVVAAAIPQG